MKPLAKAVEALGFDSAWLDGEIVVLDDEGKPNFNALQNAFDASRTDAISYFLFDLPYFEGHDLRKVPLYARRALLRQLVDERGSDGIRFSADFAADPASLLQSAAALNMEGIIAKRVDAHYVEGRSEAWLKLKTADRQEFVIGGFIDREGSSSEVGTLVLGYYDDAGNLKPAGNVGTGWDAETASDLHERLVRLETRKSPFETGSIQPGRWSQAQRRDRSDGSSRNSWPRSASAAGRRTSGFATRSSRACGKTSRRGRCGAKRPSLQARRAAATTGSRVGKVKVSNPDRVIDPSTGLKKLDLVRYYESIAEWMLPHLAGRPVSLVRGPEGVTGELFFQKHDEQQSIPGLRQLDPALWPGHPALLEVPSADALVNAAQMNVIEFHTWNSTVKRIDRPDRMVLDLDPGEGVSWARVQEAALLTRTMLTELGLEGWLKTSGGKGLHVVVPLAPRLDYDTVKAFSQALVQHLARTIPSRFVAKSGASNRVGKIFVDYLRNGFGATTAAAFSARSRPGWVSRCPSRGSNCLR